MYAACARLVHPIERSGGRAVIPPPPHQPSHPSLLTPPSGAVSCCGDATSGVAGAGYSATARFSSPTTRVTDVDSAGSAALTVAPASFVTRYRLMTALLPRWGGSYEQMEELAEAAQAHVEGEPQLGAP